MIRLFRPARWLDPAMDRAHRDIERRLQALDTALGVLAEYRSDQVPPAAAHRGRLIALTDGSFTPAYSDGAQWRRLSDNAPI